MRQSAGRVVAPVPVRRPIAVPSRDFVGLASPALHVARIRGRDSRGGPGIAGDVLHRRHRHCRPNPIERLPAVAALRRFDNSADADPAAGRTPPPRLLLDMQPGRVVGSADLSGTPGCTRPVVAAALKLAA